MKLYMEGLIDLLKFKYHRVHYENLLNARVMKVTLIVSVVLINEGEEAKKVKKRMICFSLF